MSSASFVSASPRSTTSDAIGSTAALSYYFFDCPFWMECGHRMCYCSCDMANPPSQYNTRRMADFISNGSTDDADLILDHLEPWIYQMSTSSFENYLVQTLLSKSSNERVKDLVAKVDVSRLSENAFGSRVVQFLAEKNEGAFCQLLLSKMRDRFWECSTHARANYAVQSICKNMTDDGWHELIDVTLPVANKLSTHPYGAYVLQNLLSHSGKKKDKTPKNNSSLRTLVESLLDMGVRLVLHKYGNYSAQAMIPCLDEDQSVSFARIICDNFMKCASSSAGSRVVETTLEVGSQATQQLLVRHVLSLNVSDFGQFRKLMSGRFVFNKVVACASSAEKKELRQRWRRGF